MKYLMIVLILILQGCATNSNSPYKGTIDNTVVTITWVKIPEKEIGAVCDGKTYDASKQFSGYTVSSGPNAVKMRLMPQGCAKFTKDSCTVYAYEPKNGYDLEVFGHEVLHCFIGDYHF